MKAYESILGNAGRSDPQPPDSGGLCTPDELLKKVNVALEAVTGQRQPQSLYEPVRYVLSLGGKRIRPVLMMLAYNMFREAPETIIKQAVGIETYHNFTLLHDDLMDRADMRRGHATVHRKWNENTAILSGDTMLLLAFHYMQQCDERHQGPVMTLFTETAMLIDEGQQLDIDFETRLDVTEQEYIEMIRLKTSVLLACALKTGAVLADASPRDCDLLYSFGEKIGLAFQLQDDLLDVYGDPAVFGKAIGGDITSNKKTYMLINALNRATEAQHRELTGWIEAKQFDREEKVAAVTRLYDAIGIRALCEQKIEQYFQQAGELLQQVSIDDNRKEQLRQYTAKMVNRKY
ncbi:MAG: polyprenyl synthetase family protein [Prevotella sp.]|nr:polyprenyl synthetase family protein [Prevotella sp.]